MTDENTTTGDPGEPGAELAVPDWTLTDDEFAAIKDMLPGKLAGTVRFDRDDVIQVRTSAFRRARTALKVENDLKAEYARGIHLDNEIAELEGESQDLERVRIERDKLRTELLARDAEIRRIREAHNAETAAPAMAVHSTD